MLKKNDDHGFVIKDVDLFEGSAQVDLRTLRCAVCGVQPGQGVHAPPPPKPGEQLAEEVAKTLSGIIDEPWTTLRREAARASFTTVQQISVMLHDMGSSDEFASMTSAEGNFFDVLSTRLDGLLTELRKLGWDQGDQR